ncbi:MAG: hypothetical protein C4532_11620 [Candidatus Abyssobacteria bacterium SURF_17]|uniref:Uncharacterized protein n=1 Tax=Candidatus Abyssobacteria bacterium SURF_17 TaxID=2093361 RepID=A0A419EWF8_9BACT|nr:MAG: hypothetical protein C4532_11620 [Candidatus Abyssubacteria bacterium SURF_17]
MWIRKPIIKYFVKKGKGEQLGITTLLFTCRKSGNYLGRKPVIATHRAFCGMAKQSRHKTAALGNEIASVASLPPKYKFS